MVESNALDPPCRALTDISCPVTSGTFLTAAIKESFYEVCARSSCYLCWVFEAKKRFGLSVLNHMHLLAKTPARML
jgi:hypothetical protein